VASAAAADTAMSPEFSMFDLPAHRPPAAPPTSRVRADLAVHLQGTHTAEAVTMARSVLLVMPAARIRIAHPQPAYAAYTAWAEALPLAAQLFEQTRADSDNRVPKAGADIAGHLTYSTEVTSSVDCFTAEISPTTTPQIRVQLGGLLVIAADAAAVISQASVWTTAYGHAARLWPELPPLASLAAPQAAVMPIRAAA